MMLTTRMPEIFTFPEPNSNLIRVSAEWPISRALETVPLQNYLTAQMMLKGTQFNSGKSFFEKLNYWGASIDFVASMLGISCEIFCHKDFFNEVLNLYSEAFYSPIFPKSEWNLLLSIRTQNLKELLMDTSVLADRALLDAIFADEKDWYSNSIAHYNAISLAHCKSQYNQFLSLPPTQWYLAGDFTEKDYEVLCKLAENKNRGKLEIDEKDHSTKNYGKNPIPRQSQHQKSIRIGTKISFKNEKDYLALEIMNMALGGYFESRLMQLLRQEKGYTYGVFSSIFPLKNFGSFTIQLETSPKHVQNCIDTIFEEYERFYLDKELLEEALKQFKASWMRNTNQVLRELELRRQIDRIGLSYQKLSELLQNFDIEMIDKRQHPIGAIENLKTVVL